MGREQSWFEVSGFGADARCPMLEVSFGVKGEGLKVSCFFLSIFYILCAIFSPLELDP